MKFILIGISLFLVIQSKFSTRHKLSKSQLKTKKFNQQQDPSIPSNSTEKEYYFDTSVNFDPKDYNGKILAITQKGVDGSHFVPQYSYNLKPVMKTATTEEQPYYDPTMNPIGVPKYANFDHDGLWYVPIKLNSKADRLKMDRIRRQNVQTQRFLFKHPKPEDDVYYDSSINPPSLQVEDQMQKALRLHAESVKDKKSITFTNHLDQLQDRVEKHDLILNRQTIYQTELPDKRIQRQNEFSQILGSGYQDRSLTQY